VGAASERGRRRHTAPLVAAASLGLLLASGLVPAAHGEAQLVPAYAESVMRGPAAAKGAVIWSHGASPFDDESRSPNPSYLATLRDAGWDIFRNNRLGEPGENQRSHASRAERLMSKTDELSGAVDRLKAEGYREVAIAGQSYGAWLSLSLADRRSDIYAVIATAPAAYGTLKRNPKYFEENKRYLTNLVDELKVGRVLVTFFRDDAYDPGGRGPETEAALARRHILHLVIDQPEIPTGHGGANGAFFARRFGPCLVAFLDAPRPPSLADCASASALEPSGEVLLPPALTLATAAGDAQMAPFLGEWWGIYGNGRELILAIEKVDGDRVEALYAYGPFGPQSAGMEELTGQLKDGRLVFAIPGKPRLEYRLEPDGRLAASWNRGDTTLTAELRRISP